MLLKIIHGRFMIMLILIGVDYLINVKSYVEKRKADIKDYVAKTKPTKNTLVIF